MLGYGLFSQPLSPRKKTKIAATAALLSLVSFFFFANLKRNGAVYFFQLKSRNLCFSFGFPVALLSLGRRDFMTAHHPA